jgi:hypothetical protein
MFCLKIGLSLLSFSYKMEAEDDSAEYLSGADLWSAEERDDRELLAREVGNASAFKLPFAAQGNETFWPEAFLFLGNSLT